MSKILVETNLIAVIDSSYANGFTIFYFPESRGFLNNVIEGYQDPGNTNELCSEEGIELNQKYSSKSAGRCFIKSATN